MKAVWCLWVDSRTCPVETDPSSLLLHLLSDTLLLLAVLVHLQPSSVPSAAAVSVSVPAGLPGMHTSVSAAAAGCRGWLSPSLAGSTETVALLVAGLV